MERLVIPRPVNQITWSDLQALVDAGRPEGRDIEYKLAVHGSSDSDKLEFLYDITSLANAGGGDLIFGVRDEDGVAAEIPGIEVTDVDELIRRLEASAKDGTEPRLSVYSGWINKPGSPGVGTLVMRTPFSLAAPHRVRFKNNGKFYTRASRAKLEMDVHQLREAFLASADQPSRLRAVHTKWVDDAFQSRPLTLVGGADVHLTIIPISFLREGRDLAVAFGNAVQPPIMSGGFNATHTLDGWLNYSVPTAEGAVWSYALTGRQGYVSASFHAGSGESLQIYTDEVELMIWRTVESAVTNLSKFQIAGPWVAFMTMTRIDGFYLEIGQSRLSTRTVVRQSPRLDFPEQIIVENTEAAILPLLRLMWFAFGVERPAARSPGNR